MKYFLFTLGCQQNVHDSQRLRTLFNNLGFEEVSEKQASLIVVVACSVRQKAVDRVFGLIRNWQKKCAPLGCTPTILTTACVLPSDRKKFEEKGVRFFGIEDLNKLRPLLRMNINDDLNAIANNQSASAYLPIMSGCNNFCSYCAVPYTRGREKSRPVDEIVADFRRLIKSGHKEITLLGQNVNSYKMNQKVLESESPLKSTISSSVIPDLPAGRHGLIRPFEALRSPQALEENPDKIILDSRRSLPLHLMRGGNDTSDFARLLAILNDLEGDFTIKFLTNHPKDMGDDLIETIAKLPRVAKQIHLPLQSGSNKILEAMNRHYTKEQYLKLISKLKAQIPNVEINTDIIVGFPGETEADFQDTVEVVKKSGFAVAYISPYSPRPGTPSTKLPDDIPLPTKKARFRILDSLINKHKNQ